MSSIEDQFLDLKEHHSQYSAIDPKTTLKESASGKTIFLTGASRGIGQATAVAFAQAGAEAVYITARSEKGLKETKAKVAEANPGTQCAYMVCDVTDAEQVKTAVEDCANKFGGIDIVDANAGILDKWDKIGESDVSRWWRSYGSLHNCVRVIYIELVQIYPLLRILNYLLIDNQ